MKKKEKMNFWVSPEGKVFKCNETHNKWAAQFLKEKWGEDWYREIDITRIHDTLEAWSWVRILDRGLDTPPDVLPKKEYYTAPQKAAIFSVFKKYKFPKPEFIIK